MSIVTCRSLRSRESFSKPKARATDSLFQYIGGTSGPWRVENIVTRAGIPLPLVSHIDISTGGVDRSAVGATWILNCIANNTRFVTREEPRRMESPQVRPGDSENCAALVLVRCSSGAFSYLLDEKHETPGLALGRIRGRLNFLPTIMRRMQIRTAQEEVFDCVTWLEYAPQDAMMIDDLINAMRSSDERKAVEREIVMKLVYDSQRAKGVASPRGQLPPR